MRLKRLKYQWFALAFAVCTFAIILPSCGVKDSSIETAIAATPALAGVQASVKDGVVTLNGEFKDAASKDAAETAAKTIKGVKSVVNNGTIAAPPPPPPAPVEISADDALTTAVADAIKSFPGVTAAVKDGVVTLTGEVKRSSLKTLMMALNTLKPKKIENKLTIK